MKRKLSSLLLILFCILLTQSHAQDCTRKTDDAGQTIIESPLLYIAETNIKVQPSFGMKVGVKWYKGVTALLLLPEFKDLQTIRKDDAVEITLDDKSLLKLAVTQDNVSQQVKNPYGTVALTNALVISLTNEQKAQLSTRSVKKIRIAGSDYLLRKDRLDQIKTWLKCLEASK
jgi:hypothetical protein